MKRVSRKGSPAKIGEKRARPKSPSGLLNEGPIKTEVPSRLTTAGHLFLVGTQIGSRSSGCYTGARPEGLRLLCGLFRGLLGGGLLRRFLGRLLGGRRLLGCSLLGHRCTSFCYDVPGDSACFWAGAEPQATSRPPFLLNRPKPNTWCSAGSKGHPSSRATFQPAVPTSRPLREPIILHRPTLA